MILGELLVEAGLPAGVVNVVLGYGQPVGATLASHPSVDMVTFTGSTAVGRGIAAAASTTLKKVALELGGKNPQVIFPDADLDSAADAVTFGVYFNVGQCCNSGSRIIVHEDIAEAFTSRVADLSRQVVFGDPLHPDTQVGAIVSREHGAKIDAYVTAAREAGATVILGGAALQVPGLGPQFYQPTIVTNVTPDMAIAREEVFGPVLTVLTFRTLDEALHLVNDADYGLSAGVWSENVHTCLSFARAAQAGTVWTNTWMDGFPEVTFGGVKQSGLGREIGRYGLDEFMEIKSLVMRIGRTRAPWVRPANNGKRSAKREETMRLFGRTMTAAAALVMTTSIAMAEDVEVLHWWTSGGEAAALNVLKDNLAGAGTAGSTCPSRAAVARLR